MRKRSKRRSIHSIYVQLLLLLFFSAAAAAVLFQGLDMASTYLIDRYIYNSEYLEKWGQKYADDLQEYIQEHALVSTDSAGIGRWVKEQKIIVMRIYKNDILIYDSEYPGEKIWQEEIPGEDYGWENSYPMQFADGTGTAVMVGAYDYQIFNYALITELVLSFGVFVLLVLLGIRRKMHYIRKLSEEIEILEGGSLEYPITVSGKDELAVLAKGLDHMRISFQNLIQSEARMAQENQRIVTEMSHDLRTPVTSIMLYTEILKKGDWEDKERQMEYVERIDRKARRMKQLTDHLFEYSLITGETEVQMEEPELYEVVLYDLFSETCSYLKQKGFQVVFRVQWVDRKIQVSNDYLMRIMDNITSNIIKYGDPSQPVTVSSVCQKHMSGFRFQNRIRDMEEKTDSTGIGIQSIKNMMQKMGGQCITEQKEKQFFITLLFPEREE